uniref:Elongation factor Ts, mitochondrial n=1 Tax=Lygus hesperus TaxID=30085 RepID=A0A0A9W9G1_LYGHE
MHSGKPTAPPAALVKQLRDMSNAPMIECRKALQEVLATSTSGVGDRELLQLSHEYLRKNSINGASSKALHATADGVVVCAIDSSRHRGILVEVNCETDFVSKNELFLQFTLDVTTSLLYHYTKLVTAYSTLQTSTNSHTIAKFQDIIDKDDDFKYIRDKLVELISQIRENIRVGDVSFVNVGSVDGATSTISEQGMVCGYMHNEIPLSLSLAESCNTHNNDISFLKVGKTASLVAVSGAGDNAGTSNDKLGHFGKQVSMQIVAGNPLYLRKELIPRQVLDHEISILSHTLPPNTKPEINKKILQGKLEKFYQSVVLVNQPFLITNDNTRITVEQLLETIHPNASILQFAMLPNRVE